MKSIRLLAGLAFTVAPTLVMAADAGPLEVPAKTLPVPTADISPGLQKFISAPLNPDWNKLWKTGEEARAYADVQAAATVKTIPAMKTGCMSRSSRPRWTACGSMS